MVLGRCWAIVMLRQTGPVQFLETLVVGEAGRRALSLRLLCWASAHGDEVGDLPVRWVLRSLLEPVLMAVLFQALL